MDIPSPLSPLKTLIDQQREYIAYQSVVQKSRTRVAVAASCLCFVLGIFAGMWLTQQHYESALEQLEMAPVVGMRLWSKR